MFNDAFNGTQLQTNWTLHAGSPTGPAVDSGEATIKVILGVHRQVEIAFDAPEVPQVLYLEILVSKPGEGVQFADVSTTYHVMGTD